MIGNTGAHSDDTPERASLVAAQRGDEAAFAALTQPHERSLHLHCYRMLGSLDDADDALQETLIRAWRQIGRFEPRAPFRAWLYRIATNVCLTMLARRTRRREVSPTTLRANPGDAEEALSLDPYPDRWLGALTSATPGPEATVELQESVELAFVAAVQFLPPRQRATLLLRDVIGYSAFEVAGMLSTSVPGVNSVLLRARTALKQRQAAAQVTRLHSGVNDSTEQLLVRRLITAWRATDVPSIVALLTTDAILSMPPQPDRYVGRETIGRFLATRPGGGRLDRFQFIPTRANRQPAAAAYYWNGNAGDFVAHAVFVLALDGEVIASLVRFANPALFPRFGLPMTFAAYAPDPTGIGRIP